MRDISKIFNFDIESDDGLLYYNYDEYMNEVSYEQGEVDEQKRIIKNMLNKKYPKKEIMELTNLTKEELERVIEDIKYDEMKSNK